MEIIGYSAAILAAIIVGTTLVLGVGSISDIRRYLRLRRM
jgi:hypothetical protein